VSETRYLLYVWGPGGYSIEEREGEPPAAGAVVTVNGLSLVVGKVAASPLPNDPRSCAYLQPA
jgi:hypothetical protein